MNPEELIGLVSKIMDIEGINERECKRLMKLLKQNILDPSISDYIILG